MIEFAPTSIKWIAYNEAWLYCLTLDHNGHKDWRLPTLNEYELSRLVAVFKTDRLTSALDDCWCENDPCLKDPFTKHKWLARPVRTVDV